MNLTAKNLRIGAIYCAENALFSLRDANTLFRKARYASSCVLGIIALEHLGKCMWLLDKAHSAAQVNRKIDSTKIKEESKKHDKMLKYGLVSFEFGLPFQAVDASLAMKVVTKRMKRAPTDFYDLRIRAQYVDLASSNEWNRPPQVEKGKVHDLLLNVGNCYRFILYSFLLRQPDVTRTMQEIGLLDTLKGITPRCTWPPPEGDIHTE